MRHAKPISRREKTRRKIDEDLINAAFDFHPFDLPKLTIVKGREIEFRSALSALERKGCDPKALDFALRLGRQTRGKSTGSIPRSEKVKRLIEKLRQVADDIETVQSSGFMTLIDHEEMLRLWVEKHPAWKEKDDSGEPHREYGMGVEIRNIDFEFWEKLRGIDEMFDFWLTLPHLHLSRWLRKKAVLYERWLALASQSIRPKTGTLLTRLEYLVPAVYVREATGKIQGPLLCKLLGTTGIPIGATQLSRELKAFRSDYTSIYNYVELTVQIIPWHEQFHG